MNRDINRVRDVLDEARAFLSLPRPEPPPDRFPRQPPFQADRKYPCDVIFRVTRLVLDVSFGRNGRGTGCGRRRRATIRQTQKWSASEARRSPGAQRGERRGGSRSNRLRHDTASRNNRASALRHALAPDHCRRRASACADDEAVRTRRRRTPGVRLGSAHGSRCTAWEPPFVFGEARTKLVAAPLSGSHSPESGSKNEVLSLQGDRPCLPHGTALCATGRLRRDGEAKNRRPSSRI